MKNLNYIEEEAAAENACVNDLGSHCSGSCCMAWRWQSLSVNEKYTIGVAKACAVLVAEGRDITLTTAKKAQKMVKNNPSKYGLPTKPYLGYCGLAGEPAK